MDTGIQANHPDLQDEDGNTRVQQIDWYAYSDTLEGPLPEQFYSHGEFHGTHVAAIAAGRKNGWAKEAHIYSMNALGSSGARIGDITECFELILAWHRAKSDPTSVHYTGRPTVVNMSWGMTSRSMGLPNPKDIIFRGVTYDGPNWSSERASQDYAEFYDKYGLTNPRRGSYDVALQIPAYDALTEELIQEGCTVCIAAGNRADIGTRDTNHVDYNNRLVYEADSGFDPIYYNRAGSPYAEGALFVAALAPTCPEYFSPANPGYEELSNFSSRGDAVDIIAPGAKIRSASAPYTSITYPIITETFEVRHFVDADNPDIYLQRSESGTSMASLLK